MIWAAESAVEPADLEISDPDLWVVIYRAMERVRREECGPSERKTLLKIASNATAVDCEWTTSSRRSRRNL